MEQVCKELDIPTKSNRVDIGVRVELPANVFAHLTDELYESKIVYRTKQYDDKIRTFCMNPKGAVVNEKLESCHDGLYIIGDGSGITHSLSHASASGIHIARDITK